MENAVLIRTVETQNAIIQAEQATISILYQSLEKKVASENETVQQLLNTIQKLTEQNAKSIDQLAQHQRLASDAIKAAQKFTEESKSSTENTIVGLRRSHLELSKAY